ncbi:hypothetical protein P691DRAFT_780989 [Macrolepiota fuliginosa MF-IS2]|uniref:F-box domain-containing protein n=1 Tax=Macrolepiota fuliginosa MF-IS2 TaxID=1400762 RepID=A0A9P5XE62_9AGAR|nr:hypothetical protein P691DRAFT_780989 [Macrolepiota fuliginosa MF-IS2]
MLSTATIHSTTTLHDSFRAVAADIAALNNTLQEAPISDDFHSPIDTDTSFINSQVDEVKTLIKQLFSYRATLLRNRNFRRSAICKLPPEALGEIFQHVCYPDTKKFTVPTRLGAICSHWRHVAWSVPQLWTELNIGGRFWKSSYRLRLLDLYYKNMGGLLFNITIRRAPEENSKNARGVPFQDVFDRLFIRHADRLKTLTFEELPVSWFSSLEKASNTGQGFPNLESLEFSDNCCDNPLISLALFFLKKNPPIAFYNVPNLRRLILRDITSTVEFPWAQLTELSLSDINSETALDIVLQCQNIVTLKLEDLMTSPDIEVTLPNEELVLQNLEVFEYRSSHLSVHWEKALVKCLSFTNSLKKLIWLTRDGTPDLRREFLLRLPTSITELRLDSSKDRDNIRDLEEILVRLTSLRTIMLHLEDPIDLETVELLTVKEEASLLPTLRSIGLVMMRSEYDYQQMADILNMVRSRWEEGYDVDSGFQSGA